jgi:hypothetical protein
MPLIKSKNVEWIMILYILEYVVDLWSKFYFVTSNGVYNDMLFKSSVKHFININPLKYKRIFTVARRYIAKPTYGTYPIIYTWKIRI